MFGKRKDATASRPLSNASPWRLSRAISHLGLCDRSTALAEMEAAVKNHEIAVFTACSPLLDKTRDPIRSDPRGQIAFGMPTCRITYPGNCLDHSSPLPLRVAMYPCNGPAGVSLNLPTMWPDGLIPNTSV